MKLLNERCLKCSVCSIFFSSSLIVSIKALFLSRVLSAILINKFFMLLLTFIISWIPLKKRFSNKTYPIYPLSVHSSPLIFFKNSPYFNGSRSSTFADVNMKLRTSPLSLIIRYNLNPKNNPMEHFPRSANPLNVLWIRICWLRQTPNGVESTKLMLAQVPNKTFLTKKTVRESALPFPISRNGYRIPNVEKGVSDVCKRTPCSNAWSSGNYRSGTE